MFFRRKNNEEKLGVKEKRLEREGGRCTMTKKRRIKIESN
jgi:hypothetical protein